MEDYLNNIQKSRENIEELDDRFYEYMIMRRNKFYPDIAFATETVAKYIKREKRIIVGGTALDLAIRMKGDKLYEDYSLADYDFFTPQHFIDAYNIAEWLMRLKKRNVDAINASHPTTMRVRIFFVAVGDVTYVPPNIYEKLPFIESGGFKIIHPHFQIINQHLSLCRAYQNAPRETINFRWEKDMKRYDFIYKYYPLGFSEEKCEKPAENKFAADLIKGQMVSGLAAVAFWITEAKKRGFKCETSFGQLAESIHIPGPLIIYTNDIKDYLSRDFFKTHAIKFYNPLLDHFPHSARLENIEIYYNKHDYLAAHLFGDFHVANLQLIMVYLMSRITLEKSKNFFLYKAYIECRNLITWASAKKDSEDDFYAKLLPSAEFFGKENMDDQYLIKLKYGFENYPLKPQNLYERNLKNMSVPQDFKEYDYSKSWVYRIDGEEIKEIPEYDF